MDLLYYFKRSIVEKAIKYGLVLSPEVLDTLLHYKGNLDLLFKELSSRGITRVELTHLQGNRDKNREIQKTPAVEELVEDQPCEPKIRVSLYVDPDELEPPNWEREQVKMLQERLEFLRPLIASRGITAADYDRAMRSEEERIVIGVVLKKEVNGSKTRIYIEDGEESAVLTSPEGADVARSLRYVDQDMVVGFVVRASGRNLFIRDVLWPQLSSRRVIMNCPFRLLVIPDAYRYNLEKLVQVPHDALVLLSNVASTYNSNPEDVYRKIDAIISSREEPVFVIPGPEDLVRIVPPHPPHDASLFPSASSLDNVALLGSPTVIRIGKVSLLLYDGGYYRRTGVPPETLLYSRLIQPNISSYPYRSSRDYSLMKKVPDYVLMPVGGRKKKIGSTTLILRTKPYVLELSSGEVRGVG